MVNDASNGERWDHIYLASADGSLRVCKHFVPVEVLTFNSAFFFGRQLAWTCINV